MPLSVTSAKLLLGFWTARTLVAMQSRDVGAGSNMICQVGRQSSSMNTEQACIYLLHLPLRELQMQLSLAAG